MTCESGIPKRSSRANVEQETYGNVTIGGEKGKKTGSRVEENATFYIPVPSMSPALRNHWLLLVLEFI